MSKFAKVAPNTKAAAMEDYIGGKGTTREIALRYGFNDRRLRQWFIEAGRLPEFVAVAHENSVGCGEGMPITARVKLEGFKCIAWKGKSIEIRRGVISAVHLPRPDHPDARSGGYVAEHRLVMEEKIGRRLTSAEVVHHIDLDPTNNHPDNLLLMSSAEHALLHSYLQVALVKLMDAGDLRALSHHLLELVKLHGGRRHPTQRKKVWKNPAANPRPQMLA